MPATLTLSSFLTLPRPQDSAPLPPLPTQTPSVQGSPRSTQLGGSLGPTFIITVGDPQKVGYNPATQHTVYTVRTRVSCGVYP